MEGVQTIQVPKELAEAEWQAYRAALKVHDRAYMRDLATIYGHARKGRAVLDLWQSFKDAGLDKTGNPKLAVARADWVDVHFRKDDGGSGLFYNHVEFRNWGSRHRHNYNGYNHGEVRLPGHQFDWPRGTVAGRDLGQVLNQELATKVPIVPAKMTPAHDLSNYHILWEVEKWDIITPPRDPFLLKRVSPNMFVVLAGWELTDLERAVLRGRIA